MRLLYLTDTHIRGTSPRSRTDDFPETIRQKLIEVNKIAKREQVDYILHGGDVFDRPNLSPAVVRDFVKLLRELPAPIYAVAGNHDIYGHNPETLDRTMLGLLEAFGTIRLIQSGEKIVLEKQGIRVQLSGQPFHYDLDKQDRQLDYCVENESDADYCIHMVHGMLVEKAYPEGVAYTLVQQLWEQPHLPDILLTGHYHAGFNVQKRNGKYIVNPGAMARINSHSREISRMPQVALIDLHEGIDIRLLTLTCAKKGEMVIDRSYIDQTKNRKNTLDLFVQGIEAVNDFQKVEIREIIHQIAQADGVDLPVRNEALRRISLAEEAEGERDA